MLHSLKYRRRLHRLLAKYEQGKLTRSERDHSLRGWINHVRYGDTWGLRVDMLSPTRIRPAAGLEQPTSVVAQCAKLRRNLLTIFSEAK